MSRILKYLSPCDLRVLDEPKKFRLLCAFKYYHPYIGFNEVEKGFVTDFSSLPPLPVFLDLIVHPNDESRKPGVIHDDLYKSRGKVNGKTLTRKQCDQIYLDGLKTSGKGFVVRHTFYRFLRAFGGIHLKRTSGRGWED